MGIFQLFDLNKDGGLNKGELEALLVATISDLKYCSQEEISSVIDGMFSSCNKFIDGDKGLTCDGLLRIYDEDADLDRDFKVLGLKVKPHNDEEPPFGPWDRSEKVRIIFQQYDLNNDGGLNREELMALILATNPNVRYGEEYIDDLFNLYEIHIDGEKGLTFNGLLLIYDQGDLDLDLAFREWRFEFHPIIDDQVAWERRRRYSVGRRLLLTAFLAVLFLPDLIGLYQWELSFEEVTLEVPEPEIYSCESDICEILFNTVSILEVIGNLVGLVQLFLKL